ncbi:MAG: hypothetical protein NC112_05115 [Oxalobacter formigenes]|nr:hypothetical protein [Oxalobacter formigenes]
MNTERRLHGVKRPKPKRVREEEFVDSFDAETMEEYDEMFSADEMPFYDVCRQMERERSLGRDECCD